MTKFKELFGLIPSPDIFIDFSNKIKNHFGDYDKLNASYSSLIRYNFLHRVVVRTCFEFSETRKDEKKEMKIAKALEKVQLLKQATFANSSRATPNSNQQDSRSTSYRLRSVETSLNYEGTEQEDQRCYNHLGLQSAAQPSITMEERDYSTPVDILTPIPLEDPITIYSPELPENVTRVKTFKPFILLAPTSLDNSMSIHNTQPLENVSGIKHFSPIVVSDLTPSSFTQNIEAPPQSLKRNHPHNLVDENVSTEVEAKKQRVENNGQIKLAGTLSAFSPFMKKPNHLTREATVTDSLSYDSTKSNTV